MLRMLLFLSVCFTVVCLVRRILPESIPWLVANDRKKDAVKILRGAARFNRVELPGQVTGSS